MYRSELKKYGLSINKEKVVEFAQRPFVEAISIAKGLILRLINERFQNVWILLKGLSILKTTALTRLQSWILRLLSTRCAPLCVHAVRI